MTISVFEFRAVDALGHAVGSPSKVTRGIALDAAHTLLKTTRLARVVSTTDVRVALGDTPTAADPVLRADTAQDFYLPARVGAASTITATTAGLSTASASDVTIDLAAGATNGMLITVTAKDAAGNTVAGVHELELHFSTSSAGANVTATAYSGTLVASTGALAVTHTAAKVFRILTDANGIFVGTLTASGKPATEYVAVKKPLGGSLKVSAASGALWG